MADEPVPQRRIDDGLDQALKESPWPVRLFWYAARDAWGSATAGLTVLNGLLPSYLLWINENPEQLQKLEMVIPQKWRWVITVVLSLATLTTAVTGIVRKGKS